MTDDTGGTVETDVDSDSGSATAEPAEPAVTAGAAATTAPPALDRAALEDRRARAIRDLVETQQQLDAGELDPKTAERLMAIYQGEVVAALEGLDSLGPATAPAPKPNRHRTIAGVGIAAIAIVAIAVFVTRSGTPRQPGQFASGSAPAANAPPATDSTGGRDLSTVSNEEMEAVIAQNPNVVPMRLALAERYLEAGDFQKASEHAHTALQQNPGKTDKARALRDLGWATALQDKPQDGATLLQQSLDLEPSDQNTVFFLAKVRLEGLHDPAGAVTLLQQLLGTNISDPSVKQTVQDTLAQAKAQLNGQPAPAGAKP